MPEMSRGIPDIVLPTLGMAIRKCSPMLDNSKVSVSKLMTV